jgi:large subunit ribosomal protein L15
MVIRRDKKSRRRSFRHSGLRRRGAGNRGGRGRAGAGKRRSHKPLPSLARKGFISKLPNVYATVNLSDLNGYDKSVELPDTKVLGKGVLKKKLTVKASAFSTKAREAIEKLGGKCVEP